jgi:hypothetical protein
MCRLFRRSDHFDKCCQHVLHSHNNFAGFRATGTVSGTGKATAATDRRKLFANQLFRENTASVASQSPRELKDSTHEKGRSGGRCGRSETLFRQATV